MTRKKPKDASQAYFWTEEWQKGERKADEDIRAGRVKRFETVAEAIKYLEGGGSNHDASWQRTGSPGEATRAGGQAG